MISFQNIQDLVSRLKFSALSRWKSLMLRRRPAPPTVRMVGDTPSISAVIMSWKRPDNLPYVVEGMLNQSCISEIYVWHNYPSRRKLPKVTNIYCEANLECRVRHYFAAALRSDYLLFSDDDLALSYDQTPKLLAAIQSHGELGVLGAFGRILDMSHPQSAYSMGRNVDSLDTIVPVDVVKGRWHIVSRRSLRQSLGFAANGDWNEEEDDVFLNLSIQMRTGHPSYVIPMSGLQELPDPHSRFKRKKHLQSRDELVASFVSAGWTTKVSDETTKPSSLAWAQP